MIDTYINMRWYKLVIKCRTSLLTIKGRHPQFLLIGNALKRVSFYMLLAEGPGVARRKNFFEHSPATHECPQKNSAQSVQPFGRL